MGYFKFFSFSNSCDLWDSVGKKMYCDNITKTIAIVLTCKCCFITHNLRNQYICGVFLLSCYLIFSLVISREIFGITDMI